MSHLIKFENCYNNWSNALPIGNGVFGAMVYFEDNILTIPLNHYEVYYNKSSVILPDDILSAGDMPDINQGIKKHQSFVDRANHNMPEGNEPFSQYGHTKGEKTDFGVLNFQDTHPSTGEIAFHFSPLLADGDHSLVLDIENAVITFKLNKDGHWVKIEFIIGRQDCLLMNICESSHNESLIDYIEAYYPISRFSRRPEMIFESINESTVSYKVNDILPENKNVPPKPFSFSGAFRSKCAKLDMFSCDDLCAKIRLLPDNKNYELIFGIFTQWNYKNLPDYDVLDSYEDTDKIYREHKKYRLEFNSRANISLPDKFIEKIWYVNQYALDCCSGKDGIMKHHACGLNGLWDIKHPNLWGSLWYWDVNIQASFAGVFSSNRLELGKVFSDGLLSYAKLAENFAVNTHGLSGIAMDYPYAFYYCIWPWSAQYLWLQYEYSQDKNYLKNEAYPLFIKLCEFAIQVFKWDENKKCYFIYPDISPEQGPLSHNTVSTVASVRYMLEFTLKASEILDDNNPILKDVKHLYENLPDYPVTEDSTYGKRFKDSDDAPANLWIRHPGMLMPVFPVGEIDKTSSDELKEIASNTINYLEDNCEIGVFQCSWLSAAASRLGKGQKALRLLYERGIDHLIRSNGLTAEANERFMNFCLKIRQPLYYPCMMEFTGEMLAAVNEMLIQSHNNIINIFPALPDGSNDYDKANRHAHRMYEYEDRYKEYPAWENVKFTNMLTKGAFEVSAELKDNTVEWIEIISKAGLNAKVTSPYDLSEYKVYSNKTPVTYEFKDNIISFDTEENKTYIISKSSKTVPSVIENQDDCGIINRTTYTNRHIFIGEDKLTSVTKKFDDFIRDWYFGNVRMENHTVYKFDITENKNKDYRSYMARQSLTGEPGMTITFVPFYTIDNSKYSDYFGYGFEGNNIVMGKDSSSDLLFKDYATSTEDGAFSMELPRGRYEVLIVSGSEDDETLTKITTNNGFTTGGKLLKKGEYLAEVVPFSVERDGKVSIKLSTEKGYNWKANVIFVNMVKGYGF